MAHRRRSRSRALAGSSTAHTARAQKTSELTLSLFKQAKRMAKEGRCSAAFHSLLEASFANGVVDGNTEWMHSNDIDRFPQAQTEMVSDDALVTFETHCPLPHGSKLAGMRRRSRR